MGTALRLGAGALLVLLAVVRATGDGPGPDVIVGKLHQTLQYTLDGPVMADGVAYRAYSIGTISCNLGTEQLDWYANTNQHPVIAQNLYRLKDGRIEQLGLSWLKHGFCALQQGLCGACNPAGSGCETRLGVGCSDPYDASLNGSQSGLGPRWQVNASTGFFNYPYATQGQTGNALYKRLRVPHDALDPALNAGVLYFAEGLYIHPDDAAAGHNANNASYRPAEVLQPSYHLHLILNTYQQLPAIFAWRDHGGGLGVADPSVSLTPIDVPGDGRFWVAARVSYLNAGAWRYEYAIENISSDRSGGSFSVPLPAGVAVSNITFRDVDYHSGEPFDNTDWTKDAGGGAVTWTSPQPFAVDGNSNALRFGTLYNFGFEANRPPVSSVATLGLFKPGTPTSMNVSLPAPSAVPVCAEDCSGDGQRDQTDLALLLSCYDGEPCCDIDGDGETGQSDLAALLAVYDTRCE